VVAVATAAGRRAGLAGRGLWWVLPSAGSTDMAAGDLETAVVQQGRFDDALPLRASVAPRVTTLVSARAGGRSTIWSFRTARWSPPDSRWRC
jgi:HlyD family secretion protein